MVKVALFAGNRDEADQYIQEFNLDPEEVRFVDSEADIEDITDPNTSIVLHGQYYERPQWYTELADRLSNKLSGGLAATAKPEAFTPEDEEEVPPTENEVDVEEEPKEPIPPTESHIDEPVVHTTSAPQLPPKKNK